MLKLAVCVLAAVEYITTFYLSWRGRIDIRLRELNPFLRFCLNRFGFWPFQIGRLILEILIFGAIIIWSNWIPLAIIFPGLLFVVVNNVLTIRKLGGS